ncbi:YheC/YheD family protein [Rossellomorea aquimaris]|uniref:YheC/YheD family endospore coat-associated protein n=1 Tax=Rossellomorea aquimaris TaxID=189382 RepID=UPI001CD28650|nr:YheC/YheD family protein [Rossellomorea aquimaris]MCA1059634.1 YheC/YheD family protein [Rossellomorea aquimaris]
MKIKCSFRSHLNTNDHHHLYVPTRIMKNLTFKRHMTLKCGNSLLDVICMETKADSLQIMLDTTDSLFASLPNLESIWVSTDERKGIIHLGPVVALLINQSIQTHSLKEYFTECQDWFQRKGGFFYLLPLSSFIGNETGGVVHNGSDWETKDLPLPHLIYNRCHSRKMERSPSFQKALIRLREKDISLFNSGFLAKDEVYHALKDSPVISQHLPETVQGFDSLEEMLTDFQDVFIKGINGSKGRYIMRIQKRDSGFHMRQNTFSPENPLTFPSYSALYKQIRSWCKSTSYIVQETIPFLSIEDQPLDFRFLCHQNRKGDWELVSSVARIAARDQFVANVDQGGRIEKPLLVLQSFFSPQQSRTILKEMKELCIVSAKLLADSLEGHFAEFGIDVGIDESGKPWLIEINSKPSKRTYLENDRIRPSVKALYEYSFSKWIE